MSNDSWGPEHPLPSNAQPGRPAGAPNYGMPTPEGQAMPMSGNPTQPDNGPSINYGASNSPDRAPQNPSSENAPGSNRYESAPRYPQPGPTPTLPSANEYLQPAGGGPATQSFATAGPAAGSYNPGYSWGYAAPSYAAANPEAVPTPVLASWPRRALGGLVDWLLPSLVLSMASRIFQQPVENEYGLTLTRQTGPYWVIALLVTAFNIYNIGYRNGVNGKSFGHQVAKLTLVSSNTGQPIGIGPAIGRLFAHAIDTMLCFIGWLFPLWDNQRQTLADKMLSSVVIDDTKLGLPGPMPTSGPMWYPQASTFNQGPVNQGPLR